MAYIAGDPWRICDRCGFAYRSSQTFKTWDNLYVCAEDFETRHPQDFVRGRKDREIFPGARPEPVDNIIGPLMTALSAAATPASTSLSVESSARFESGDHIAVVCESGTVLKIVNTVPTGTSITITTALGASAAEGAIVINNSAVAEADIG